MCSNRRLENIAKINASLSLQVCAPAVQAYICWVGGYVKPFLDRLSGSSPPESLPAHPMYSMSTETLETVGISPG